MYNVFVIEHNIKANPKESNAGKKKKKKEHKIEIALMLNTIWNTLD